MIVSKSPDVLSGTLVFYGTRVPVQNLIDYLSTGETIDAFLDDFPSVSREQAITYLKITGAMVEEIAVIRPHTPFSFSLLTLIIFMANFIVLNAGLLMGR